MTDGNQAPKLDSPTLEVKEGILLDRDGTPIHGDRGFGGMAGGRGKVFTFGIHGRTWPGSLIAPLAIGLFLVAGFTLASTLITVIFGIGLIRFLLSLFGLGNFRRSRLR